MNIEIPINENSGIKNTRNNYSIAEMKNKYSIAEMKNKLKKAIISEINKMTNEEFRNHINGFSKNELAILLEKNVNLNKPVELGQNVSAGAKKPKSKKSPAKKPERKSLTKK